MEHKSIRQMLGSGWLMNDSDSQKFGGSGDAGYNVEEITLGLPVQEPTAVALDERIEVSRYLARRISKIHRAMLGASRPSDVLAECLAGIRSATGCTEVELWLHDPAGALVSNLGDASELQGLVNLTPDSSKISSLYGDAAAPRKLAPGEASRHNVLEQAGDRKDVVVIPAVEQSHIVGSLHIKAPKLGLLDGEGDKELLFDFMNLVPVTLRQAMASQAASELMLVDPVTRVANREGLSRDLDREIGRARRAHRQVGLVGIRLCGLEGMANLSQQHIQTQLLSEVAHKIASGLRATDAVGRIDTMCFGVLVTEAPPDSIESICTRYQKELEGNLLDDGAGGSIEILPNVSWVSIDPHDYSGRAVSELSEMMLESVLEASACAPSGSVSIARAQPQ